jgi:DNA-binding MarR family transcriptional regulator
MTSENKSFSLKVIFTPSRPNNDLKRSDCMERVSRQRVGLVPARYLDHPEVGALELAILLVLCTHANCQGICWPSQATIAAKTKLDRSTVNRILANLVGLGLIEKSRHPNSKIRARTYRLVGHETLMGDFLDGLDHAAEDTLAEVTVAGDNTEHFELPEQESLCLARASAPEREEVFENLGRNQNDAAPLDTEWIPSLADMMFAQAHRTDLTPRDVALVAQKFVLHYRGQPITDPSALFRRWLLTERKFHARINDRVDHRPAFHADGARGAGGQGGVASSHSSQTRFDAWARAALARREHFTHLG